MATQTAPVTSDRVFLETGMDIQQALAHVSAGRVTLEAYLEWDANRLKAAEAKGKIGASGPLRCKVSEKGALSVYGLQRMPVTLYAGQWERLIVFAPTIGEFIKANPTLARKS